MRYTLEFSSRYSLAGLLVRIWTRSPWAHVDLVLDDDPAVVDAVMMAGFSARLADWTPRDDVLNDAQERKGRT